MSMQMNDDEALDLRRARLCEILSLGLVSEILSEQIRQSIDEIDHRMAANATKINDPSSPSIAGRIAA